METSINQIVMQNYVQQELSQQPNLVNGDEDIDLTPEEIEKIITDAKRKKLAKKREREYWERISKPVEQQFTDAETLQKIIINKAKDIIEHFVVDDFNRDILWTLSLYFSNDKRFETQNAKFSLGKGLLLFGGVGCGKTLLMRLFQTNQTNSFVIRSSRRVADDYSKIGAEALKLHASLVDVYPQEHFGQKKAGVCFDDLGTETTTKYFGKDINAMENVIYERYDNGLARQTHITTNLSTDGIEEFYGARIASRMREMFNPIIFSSQAPDRRR